MLQHKTALITGAGRGIGAAIARCFAREGADIAFTDLREDEETRKLCEELSAMGVKVHFYVGDVVDFEKAHTIVRQVVEEWGKIDILVLNAGITRDGLLLRMSEQQWDEVMAVNLKSMFNYAHAVAPVMMRQHGGSIVALSSVVGLHGNAGQANYAASKAGVIGLVKSISRELGSRNIRANAIAPGFIDTTMTQALTEEQRNDITRHIPLQRAGKVEEVADVALFLASDRSSYITGQVIAVDGGM